MEFSKILKSWYLNNKRSLPWRESREPYHIWLSEIMLQQTRVEQGLPYYEKFIEAHPTVFDLANAPLDEILKLWQGLGYYSRARNLHYTANYIVNELNGKFPNNYKDLKELKGVGDYTASAIASICYGEPVAVVDGNVYRVLSRIFGIDTPINSSEGFKEFKLLAAELMDEEDPSTFNQALMEFGALQCKPKSPDCLVCPFNGKCIALRDGRINELPVKLKKTKVRKRYFNYLVFEGNRTLLEQRTGKGIWQGLYQFPLLETDRPAGVKMIAEKPVFKELVNGSSFTIKLFNEKMIVHKLSHQHLYTRFWMIDLQKELENGVSLEKLSEYPVPVLIENFLNEYLSDNLK